MPVEVKYYRCAHKCGRNARASKKAVEKHEDICWMNPGNRCCNTCNDGDYVKDSDGYKAWAYWDCSNKNGSDLNEKTHPLRMDGDGLKASPVFMCPHWAGDTEQEFKPEIHAKWLESVQSEEIIGVYAEPDEEDLPF